MLAGCIAIIPVTLLVLGCSTNPADRLARRVCFASGADEWEQVISLSFTITTRTDVSKSERTYVWNRTSGTLTFTEKGKSSTIDLGDSESHSYQAWLEDSFWLLAPFQLLDRGVTRIYRGTRTLNGTDYEVLEVCLPSRHCLLYINPQNGLIEASEFSILDTPLTTAWQSPREVDGLIFATTHRSAVDPDLILAKHYADNAKAAHDNAMASISQGQDPPGVDQILPFLYSNEGTARFEEYKAMELKLGKDNPQLEQIKRRAEQWRQVAEREEGEARARAKLIVLEQYKQVAEAEMARFQAMQKHQGHTIEISDIHITRQ